MIWLKDTVEAFLNEQGFKESTLVVYLRGLLLLSRAEESNRKPIYRFSESEMHHTFRSITTGLRTRQKLRSLVDRYMDWVARKGIDVSKGKESLGTLDMAILERESTKLYFYGIHQLLTKLKYDVEYIAAQAGRQQSDYRMIKSALMQTLQHQCYGCEKRRVGCRKTCKSWMAYELAQKAKDLEKRKVMIASEINEREKLNSFKDYIKCQKLSPRSASNYY